MVDAGLGAIGGPEDQVARLHVTEGHVRAVAVLRAREVWQVHAGTLPCEHRQAGAVDAAVGFATPHVGHTQVGHGRGNRSGRAAVGVAGFLVVRLLVHGFFVRGFLVVRFLVRGRGLLLSRSGRGCFFSGCGSGRFFSGRSRRVGGRGRGRGLGSCECREV